MSGKYMDFVPVRFKPAPEEVSNVRKPVDSGDDFDISKVDDVEVTEILQVRTEEKVITSATAEDFSSRFVKKEVEKRPLGRIKPVSKEEEIEEEEIEDEVKDEAVKEELKAEDDDIKEETESETKEDEDEDEPKVEYTRFPKARFVNVDKVVQRPLSPNSAPKKPIVPTEEKEPAGPVTIIEKPEKDSKVAMVVAVVLTIILGAAAGTVAFLLLPK